MRVEGVRNEVLYAVFLFVCFFDVASFFVCLVLIEHVQGFEPQVGHSQRDSALQKCIYYYYYYYYDAKASRRKIVFSGSDVQHARWVTMPICTMLFMSQTGITWSIVSRGLSDQVPACFERDPNPYPNPSHMTHDTSDLVTNLVTVRAWYTKRTLL